MKKTVIDEIFSKYDKAEDIAAALCQDEFIQVLVDCKGYSLEDAKDLHNEYNGNLWAWIKDIGGDEISIQEARNYLGY